MSITTRTIGVVIALLACSSSHAQNSLSEIVEALEAQQQRKNSEDLLTGIVVNRTVTVLGWDFYDYFSSAWRENEASDRYSVSVHERPTAIRGSEIWVEYNNKRVFHTYLSPARSAVKEVSAAAVSIAYQNIERIDIDRLLHQDQDLGSEEL